MNRSFNVGQHIATIWGTNINPGIPQYKNYWSWDYTTFTCQAHGIKCPKCNRLHKLKHHHDMRWYCKYNFKINPPRLKTPKNVPYTHSFKCINYKEEYQANNTSCSFWKHWFNWDWHNKKSQELQDIKANSVYSVMNGSQKWLLKILRFLPRMFARTIYLQKPF